MLLRFFSILAVLPLPAFAHIGHVGELAGHDHVVVGAALGAAVIAGVIGLWKGKDADEDIEDTDEDLQEA